MTRRPLLRLQPPHPFQQFRLLAPAAPVGETGWTVSTRASLYQWRVNRLRRTRSDVFPLLGVVAAAVLILIGRTQRITPVAIAGYTLLALSAVLYLLLRRGRTG